MKILLLANKFDTYTLKDVKRSSMVLGFDLKCCSLSQSSFESIDIVINRISGINYDDSDLYFQNKYFLSQFHCNETFLIKTFRDKLLQYLEYKKNDIDTPQTIDLEFEKKIKIFDFFSSSKRVLIKPKRSNQSIGIFETVNLQDTYFKLKSRGDLRYIAQEFIPKKREWRVYVINKEVYACLVKISDSLYTIMNCEMAILKEEKPVAGVLEIVRRINISFSLFYCALDIAETLDGRFLLIETNCMPGMKYVDGITGRKMSMDLLLRIIEKI